MSTYHKTDKHGKETSSRLSKPKVQPVWTKHIFPVHATKCYWKCPQTSSKLERYISLPLGNIFNQFISVLLLVCFWLSIFFLSWKCCDPRDILSSGWWSWMKNTGNSANIHFDGSERDAPYRPLRATMASGSQRTWRGGGGSGGPRFVGNCLDLTILLFFRFTQFFELLHNNI